jgi:hypothetical protein
VLAVRYVERSRLVVRGPATGRQYEFTLGKPTQMVAAQDADALLRTRYFVSRLTAAAQAAVICAASPLAPVRSTQNTPPFPSSVRWPMSPPTRLARARQMLRPSPLPGMRECS